MSERATVTTSDPPSRRGFLKAGLGSAGLLGAAALATTLTTPAAAGTTSHAGHGGPTLAPPPHHELTMPGVVGEVDHHANGFNPTDLLTDFDGGQVSRLPDGRTLREYRIIAQDKMIEIVPGIEYLAWTYNGRVPGPTIRARENDRLRIRFLNAGTHPHSMHFHGIHPGTMDGVFDRASGIVMPGDEYVYE